VVSKRNRRLSFGRVSTQLRLGLNNNAVIIAWRGLMDFFLEKVAALHLVTHPLNIFNPLSLIELG
jgi:hypothetical protein